MAYSLCSSSSSFLHKHRSLPNSPGEPKSTSFTKSPTFNFRTSVQIRNVSLQNSISEKTQMQNLTEDGNTQNPYGKIGSFARISANVNPRSNRKAPPLKNDSNSSSRYSSILNLSKEFDSCNPIEEEIIGVLKKFGKKLYEQDAVVILNNMSNPDSALLVLNCFVKSLKPEKEAVFYNVTMNVFKKCKDFVGAEKVFDEMLERGVKPDKITFLTLLGCARASSLPEKAVELFEKKIPSLGFDHLMLDGSIRAVMIDPYGKVGNVDTAFSLYEQAKAEKWRIDQGAFYTLIRIRGMAENYVGCVSLYKEMKALGVKPNIRICNFMLDAMGRARRPYQAKTIYTDMIDKGITPNWRTYAALLHAFGRARYAQDVFTVYDEMKEKGFVLNTNLYNTLLAVCADLGYIDEGLKVFQEMKESGIVPDSWTFSSMITLYACCGRVSEAEGILNGMIESGIQPTIFVLTSLIQCYGKVQQTDNIVKTFDKLLELGIAPDDWFCGCLLNVMTQTPIEELFKLTACVDTANPNLGRVVKLLVEENDDPETEFIKQVSELFEPLPFDVKKAYTNCLINLCINLNKLERACELLELGISIKIYAKIQSRTPTQTSLNLKGLSHGAALTALHIWINDLSKAIEAGEELPPLLGINTGHGKHRYADQGLAPLFHSHLQELKAPFHEATDKRGWFLTTTAAFKSWLES